MQLQLACGEAKDHTHCFCNIPVPEDDVSSSDEDENEIQKSSCARWDVSDKNCCGNCMKKLRMTMTNGGKLQRCFLVDQK